MPQSRLHHWITRAEEALLERTLLGRRLEVDVHLDDGKILFPAGTEIDREVLDRARERERLADLAHAAEPGTSDSELADLLWWRRRHDEEAARR